MSRSSPSHAFRAKALTLLKRLNDDRTGRIVEAAPQNWQYLAGNIRPATSVDGETVSFLLAQGLIAKLAPGGYGATDEAASFFRRLESAGPAYLSQHQALAIDTNHGSSDLPTYIDLDESPVAHLARRRDRFGKRLLEPHQVEAAERLRRDFEIAGLQPRMTASHFDNTAPVSRRSRCHNVGANLADSAVAARQRLDKVAGALGPELAGVAFDACCFLKGMETIERDRRWPARSAKLVLSLALTALARHFGLVSHDRGSERNERIRHWGSNDYCSLTE